MAKGAGNGIIRTGRTKGSQFEDFVYWTILSGPPIGIALWLIYGSMTWTNCMERRDFSRAALWFDPIFFQYNMILGMVAILVVPTVPLLYVRSMAGRKRARLERDLGQDEWSRIAPTLDRRMSYRFYLGETFLATVIVSLGVTIMLFMKPVMDKSVCGVDVSLGANFLLLGPFITSTNPVESADYFKHLITSLVGFQFGFLGAYIYFLTALARAYFSLDLTPETLIDGTIRIAIASVTALVLAFGATMVDAPSSAPMIAFFFGFFPKRAMFVIERSVTAMVKGLAPDGDQTMPLISLNGLSAAAEVRLEREGFDNVENLVHGDAARLAMNTGFAYWQLRQWISEAWLAAHLRDDYRTFVTRTAITSKAELALVLPPDPPPEAIAILLPGDPPDADTARLRTKILVLRDLLARQEAGA